MCRSGYPAHRRRIPLGDSRTAGARQRADCASALRGVLIMGAIYLVRHGQAAFGTDDYDRLTEIGHRQAHLLGGFLAIRQVRCEAIYAGTLRRHTETVRGILDGGPAIGDGSAVESIPGLDEYKSESLMASFMGVAPAPLA